jgi:ABC-2 type transport system permease protein
MAEIQARRRTKTLFLARKFFLDMAFSPAAPVAAIFLLLGSGIPFLFPAESVIVPNFSFGNYASRIPLLAIVFFPALAAGVWESERREGTFDLLLSFPASDLAVALAKTLALFFVYAIAILLTVPLALSLPQLGASLGVATEISPLLPGYCMLLLFGLLLSAFTAFVSLRFSGAVVPILVSAAAIAFFDVVHLLPSLVDLPASLSRLCMEASLAWHLDASFRGIVDSRDVLFFALPTVFFIALSALRILKVRETA